MATRFRVFLYGTLKSGQPNFRVLSDPKTGSTVFLGTGQTVKRYPMVVTPQFVFPFLLPVEGRGEHVEGEIYEVNDTKLKRLDEFEGHPDFYLREKVHVTQTQDKFRKPLDLPETLECWVYFLPRFESKMIELPCIKCYTFNPKDQLPFLRNST